MDQELKELKSVLRSLVVSSPTQVDVRSLARDYRSLVGGPLPLAKYGYRDVLSFLKERCSDCFVFTGPANDPTLTLIVPEALKHIDQFVQRQKLPTTVKYKGKRSSIQEQQLVKQNLVASTYTSKVAPKKSNTSNNSVQISNSNKQPVQTQQQKKTPVNRSTTSLTQSVAKLNIKDTESNKPTKSNIPVKANHSENGTCSSDAVQNFLKKRLPVYDSSHYICNEINHHDDKSSYRDDDDSGRQTSSSNSLVKAAKLEQLKLQIRDLVADSDEGVWCTDLIRLYRERYGCELNYNRFGFTSIISLVYVLDDVSVRRPTETGDWLLTLGAASASAPAPARAPPRRLVRPRSPSPACDAEDALPGIGFDPDVFPSDCVCPGGGVAAASLAGVAAGQLLEVLVAEVYSPSHFWLLRRGDNYDIALENLMDEMNQYYKWGAGKERSLALGAVAVGHYCSVLYDGDWHRSIIVRRLDSDTVKVRHVDFGTVETVPVRALRPLLSRWCALPAQASRARLAGVRPPAGGRRWPHAAAAAFLRRVRDRPLVADVAAADRDAAVLEVFLLDTSTEEDVCISSELIREGHADARHDSALKSGEWHLFPRFEALESGDTPNFTDIHGYLRDGIALEYVEEYRRHVPSCWPTPPASAAASATPPASTPSPSPPPPPAVEAPPPAPAPAPAPAPPPSLPVTHNRVPLLRPPQPTPPPPPPQWTPRVEAPRFPLLPYGGFGGFGGPLPVFPPPLMVPQPFVSVPPGFGAWRPPAPAPAPPPPPPRRAPAPASASGFAPLSQSEREIYRVLSEVDPCAAQLYMAVAVSQATRAQAPPPARGPAPAPAPPGPVRSTLNPEALEFRLVSASTQTPPPDARPL